MSTEAAASSPDATPPDATLPKEGDVIAGKFLIQRVLGRGGMGVVVAAENVTLRQRVAVKFLLPEAVSRIGSVERFLREARSAAMIQSEHVARVFDVGTLDTGSPYMVMELLAGSDLGQLLEKDGKLPVVTAVDYVLQACEAIAEAHAHGIIHRDLKPANLFLTARTDGSSLVKVLDFGLSKRPKTDSLDASLTQANAIMGSPFYMSPEQIRSLKGLDSRSDLWSLGVILYQLIAGVRPFEAESLGALFLMIGADAPTPLKDALPGVPDALDAAIMRCLEKDPARRTQSVAELARELLPFGSADCALSVERIARLLPESAPPVRGGSLNGDSDSSIMPASSLGSMRPPAVPAEAAARSGSMQAVTSSLTGSKGSSPPAPSSPGPPSTAAASEPKKSRTPLLALAVVAALGLGAGAFLRLGPGRGVPTAAPVTALAAPAEPTTLVAAPTAPTPIVAPTVTPVAVEAPAASASAAPSASAAVSATASAAPSAPSKAAKAKAPVVVKKKDPLERWR